MHRVSVTVGVRRLVISLFALSFLSFGQNGGRFEELKRSAQMYLDSNQYDKAAGKLEEVWEQDQTDPVVAENLGIAYLNSNDRHYNKDLDEKARKAVEQAIKLGGKATFLVQHSHENGRIKIVTGGDSLAHCSGKLSVSPGRVVYVMNPMKGVENHSFDLKMADFQVTTPSGSGEFKIKAKPRSYTLTPRTKNKADSDLMLSLIREHLGAGTQ